MLRAFWLVLADLWAFVFGRRILNTEFAKTLPARDSQDYLPARQSHKAIVTPTPLPVLSEGKTVSEAPPVKDSFLMPKSLAEPLVMYMMSPSGAKLLNEPRLEFDGAIGVIPYGQSVTVRAFFGAYAKVATALGEGYLHKDSLTPKQSEVWPQFKSGQIYDYISIETVLTRRLIGDEFLAGALALPLQAGEYVLLRLLRDHHVLNWPPKRPRQIGLWHQVLRGSAQVKIGVDPKTDTIMEWVAEDSIGRLAYVEAVLADSTIRVSGVGLAVAGEYSELSLKEDVWREWRPVFISVVT